MAEIFYERGKKYNFRLHGVPYFRKTATIDGKRRSFYGDGEKDTNRKIEEAKELAAKGFDLDKNTSRTGAVFSYWLYNVKRVDSKIKASTFARYESAFRNHIEPYPIANTLLCKLNAVAVQAYFTGMFEDEGKGYATIKSTAKIWKMFCGWAQDEGYILKNPCKNLALPGKAVNRNQLVETFSSEERKAMMDYMAKTGYEYDTIVKLAFATGMRLGELLSLRWDDIENNFIRVRRSTAVVSHVDKNGNIKRYREIWGTKTANSVRNIPILPAIFDMLKDHHEKQKQFFFCNNLGATNYVFTNTNGRLIDAANLRKSFKRMLNRAGISYRRFHCIRHSFATEAIRAGVDVKDLQLLMGHSETATTYVYVQSDADSKKAAIEKIGNLV